MTKEHILRMAHKYRYSSDVSLALRLLDEDVERLIAFVRADEREACANLCEDTNQEYEPYTGRAQALNYTCAAAIRARSNHD